MSYTRRFTRQVAVHYSGTVSYPASKTGGMRSYSGVAQEEVIVEVEVDTLPFDASVGHCSEHIAGLTSSVVAMNAAQCRTISDNAHKISKTLIDGFFHSVRTDLDTQRAALEQKVAARLALLKKQADSLLEKRKTMERDYQRVSARYQTIFEDLDKQLRNKIHQVDAAVFGMVGEVQKQQHRMLHTDLVQTALATARESSAAQAQIGVALMKHHAQAALAQAHHFLMAQARSNNTFRTATFTSNTEGQYYAPVCFFATRSDHGQQQQCFVSQTLSPVAQHLAQELTPRLAKTSFPKPSAEAKKHIASYVQAQMMQRLSADDEHTARVRALIHRMIQS